MPEVQEGGQWAERIDRLMAGTTVEQVRGLVAEMRESLDRISSQVGESMGAVSGAKDDMRDAVSGVTGEIDGLKAHVITLADRIDSVGALRDDLVRALEAVTAVRPEQAIAPIAERMGTLAGEVSSLRPLFERIGSLATEIAGVRDDLGRLEKARADDSGIANGGERIRAMESIIRDGLAAVVSNIQSGAGDGQGVAELAARVDAQGERLLGAFAQRLGALQTTVMQRTDAVEARAVETGAAAAEAAEGVQAIMLQMAEALRDAIVRVSATESQIKALPTTPDIVSGIDESLRALTDTQRVGAADARELLETRLDDLGARLDSIARRVEEQPGLDQVAAPLREDLERIFDAVRADLAGMSAASSQAIAALDTEVGQHLEAASTNIRSDFELIVRAGKEEEERRFDSLGLRVTNLQMHLQQALQALQDHVDAIGERSAGIGAENVAILGAVRSEIAALPEVVDARVNTRTQDLQADLTRWLATVDERLAAVARLDDAVRELPSADTIASLVRDLPSADTIASLVRDLPSAETIASSIGPSVERVSAEVLRVVGEQGASVGARLDELAASQEALVATQQGTGEDTRAAVASLLQLAEHVQELARTHRDGAAELLNAQRELLETHARAQEGSLHARDVVVDEALSDLRDRVVSITASVAALSSLSEGLAAVAAEAHRAADSVTETRVAIEASGTAVREQVSADTSRLGARLDSVEAAVGRVMVEARTGIEGLEARVTDAVADLKGATQELGTSVTDRIDARITELVEERMSALTDNVGARLDALAAAVASGNATFAAAVDTRLGALSESVEARTTALTVAAAGMPTLDDIIGALASVSSRISTLDEIASATVARLAPVIAESATSSSGRVDSIGDDLTTVAANINEIWMRVRDTTQGLTELRAAFERTTGAQASLAEEVRERLSGLSDAERRTADLLASSERTATQAAIALDERIAAILVGVEERASARLEHVAEGVIARVTWMSETLAASSKDLDEHLAASATSVGAALAANTDAVSASMAGTEQRMTERLSMAEQQQAIALARTEAAIADRLATTLDSVAALLRSGEARDRTVVDALMELAERLPKADRGRFGDRLRAMAGRTRGEEPADEGRGVPNAGVPLPDGNPSRAPASPARAKPKPAAQGPKPKKSPAQTAKPKVMKRQTAGSSGAAAAPSAPRVRKAKPADVAPQDDQVPGDDA